MIELYKKTNQNYSNNGDFVLEVVNEPILKIGKTWEVDIEIRQSDKAAAFFVHDAVVAFKIPRYGKQLYVVTDPKKTDFETITATCYPIALWDAQHELVIRDARPTNLMGQQAMEWMLNATGSKKYKVFSDITKRSTAYYINKNFIEALCGNDENSFVNRWGGMPVYSNFEIIVNENAGWDNGIRISASKNLSAFTITEDDSDFVDTIIPVAFNGRTHPGEVVDNDRRKLYRTPHRAFIKYDWIKLKEDLEGREGDDGDIVCTSLSQLHSELEKAAKADFKDGKYSIKHTYEISYVDPVGLDEFEQYKDSERLWYGDICYCKNLDVNLQERQHVIEIEYNLLTEKVEKLTLGSAPASFVSDASTTLSAVKSVVNTNNRTVIAEKVQGFINSANAQLKAQYTAAEKSHQIAVITEVTDQSSPLYGCLCYGTQGLMLSKRKKADGQWDFSTCITASGIIADYIVTGLLSDKSGNFYFDLETGEFQLGNGVFKGTIQTEKNAEIGNKIFLDYDINSQNASSGILLGNPNSVVGPQLTMRNSENSNGYWGQLFLQVAHPNRTYIGNAPRVVLTDMQVNSSGMLNRTASLQAGGSSYLNLSQMDSDGTNSAQLKSDRVNVSGEVMTIASTDLYLNSKRTRFGSGEIYVNGKKGVTYSGKVTSITTTNGIVTAVSGS